MSAQTIQHQQFQLLKKNMGLHQPCTKHISVRTGLKTSSLPVKMNEFALAVAYRKCKKWEHLLLFSLYSAA